VVNTLDADAVAITGDLVDHRPKPTAPKLEALRTLRSRHGVFFVTGNHEHAWGARAWIREVQKLGVVVLANESRAVDAGAPVTLLGVLDPSARAGRDGDVRDLYAASRSAATVRGPRVLLAHQADARLVRDADALGVDLVLAGHTHGGQVTLFGLWAPKVPSEFGQRFRSGLIDSHGTAAAAGGGASVPMIVSNGVGTITPPARFCAPPQIVYVELVRRR
jgi:predicted MPP superfamily phosphohydrolase